MHRPRPAARRRHRPADGGEGRVVEPAAVHRRRPFAVPARVAQSHQAAGDVGRAPTPRTHWRGSTGSRPPGAPTRCSARRRPRSRAPMLAKILTLVHAGRGTEDGDGRQRRSCSRCPASAAPIRASSASWRKERSRTCCSSTAIRSQSSNSSPIRAELRRHHEGRQGLQEHAATVTGKVGCGRRRGLFGRVHLPRRQGRGFAGCEAVASGATGTSPPGPRPRRRASACALNPSLRASASIGALSAITEPSIRV